MGFIVVLVAVAVSSAILYLLLAEETDDSLSYKIPAEMLDTLPEAKTSEESIPETPGLAGAEAGHSTTAITIEQKTFLGKTLRVVMALCAGIMAGTFLLRLANIDGVIPTWAAGDAVGGFIIAAALSIFVRSGYIIDPVARTIVYEQATPFYVRRRNIAFDEISVVSVRGVQKGWPLLYNYHYLELQTVIIFANGLVLPVHDPVKASDYIFSALERERQRALKLARILGCTLFPSHHLGDVSPRQWKAGISRLREKSQEPDELEKSVFETYISSLGLSVDAPHRVKVDMTTRFEKFILAFVVSFFAITTWYALNAEWGYLAQNPRIFYVILVDCTSILVSVFGLWRLLVDEYYIFDVEEGMIEFYSRWAFWRTCRKVSSFGEVGEIIISRFWDILTSRLSAAELRFANGDRIMISDKAPSQGIPVFRALVLARLLGRHITSDPVAFELSSPLPHTLEKMSRQKCDESLQKRPKTRPGSLYIPGLGGILPTSADEILQPPEYRPRRRKRRKI